VWAVLFRVGCDVPCWLCCSVLAVLFRVGCAVPCGLCCSAWAAMFRVGCAVPCGLCCSVLAVLFRVGCAVPRGLRCSVLAVLFRVGCAVPCWLCCSVWAVLLRAMQCRAKGHDDSRERSPWCVKGLVFAEKNGGDESADLGSAGQARLEGRNFRPRGCIHPRTEKTMAAGQRAFSTAPGSS
jgi:hypothetical protein